MASAAEPAPDGVLIVDKPAGWTSHAVVGRARRLLGTRKVGHAGTLDPMATGVLVLGVGRSTRLLGHLMRSDKEYLATIRFGVSTLTDDAEGEITTGAGAAGLDRAAVAAQLPSFRGPITQVPTQVSAVKINGIRSYARVRSGEQVDLAARPVIVHTFDLLDAHEAVTGAVSVLDVDVRVICSAGTYVRALARDLGARLGTGAHLTALRRVRSGAFAVGEALTLGDADREADEPVDHGAWRARLIDPADAAARSLPTRRLDAGQAADVRYGRSLPGLQLSEDVTALLGPDGELLALYRPGADGARPISVFVG